MADVSPFTVNKVEPLTGANYQIWALKVSAILRSRKLFRDVIVENEPATGAPGSNEARIRDEWESKNDEAFGILILTLSAEQAGLFIGETNAKRVWEELSRIHTGSVEDRKIDISLELKDIKQGNNELIDAYITRARNIASRSAALGQVIPEREIVYHLVRGLHQRMDNIAIVLRPQRALTIDEIQQALREEEIRQQTHGKGQSVGGNHLPHEKAYKAKEWRKGNENRKCFICGKGGHIAKDCWNRQDKKRPENKFETNRNTFSSQKNVRKKEQANIASGSNVQEHAFTIFTAMTSDNINQPENRLWSLDSGCTRHMTPYSDWMEEVEPCETKINLAEAGRFIQAEAIGSVRMQTLTSDGLKNICIYDVLYVPKLRANLLSVKSLLSMGNQVTFTEGKASIFNENNELVAEAAEKDRMFILKCESRNDSQNSVSNYMVASSDNAITEHEVEDDKVAEVCLKRTDKEDKYLWHRRLGHMNEKYMDRIQGNEMVRGYKVKPEKLKICEPCIMGKLVQKPFKAIDNDNTNQPLELVHMDLCGPMSVESLNKSKYIFVLVDSYSGRIFVWFLKSKDETFAKFLEFKNQVENDRNVKIKVVRSDNGTEFLNRRFEELFKQEGIVHQNTVRYSPQSNGVAERANRTLLDMARTMLLDAELPISFWAEAIATAVYIKNFSPSKKNGNKTPMEKWNGSIPTVSHIKVFGCMAYFHIPEKLRGKFDPRAQRGIFVGYSQKRRAYRIFDPKTEGIVESRSVKFNEDQKGASLLQGNDSSKNELESLTYDMGLDEALTIPDRHEDVQRRVEVLNEDESEEDEFQEQQMEPEQQRQRAGRKPGITNEMIRTMRQIETAEQEERLIAQGVRRSERIKQQENVLIASDLDIPRTYKEAMSAPKAEVWEDAMKEEMQSLGLHKVWDLVPRTKEMKVVKSKWIYNIKTNLDGTIEKFKARLVAVGCSQRLGIDYDKSFSPVMKLESLRILVAFAAQYGLTVRRYDVKSAYLYGDLKELIYMEQPEGFLEQGQENKVCQLRKSLYGLPQSGLCWNEKLNVVLTNIGLTRLTSDPCIYKLQTKDKLFLLGVYVDDSFAAGSDDNFIDSIMDEIKRHFSMIELQGEGIFLGIEIKETDVGFELSQEQYVNKLLQKFGLSDCNSVKIPGETRQCLDDYIESLPVNHGQYQEMLGSLMYLSVGTRPDIAYSVSYLSQYIRDPRQQHLIALKRIFRYLKGTKDFKLVYTKTKGKLEVNTDASWNSSKDAKSYTGFTVKLGDALINWKSRKQGIVALSTCESELIAICEGVCDLKWAVSFISELAGTEYVEPPIVLQTDSKSAIDWINGVGTSARTRHINRKYYFVRDEVKKGNIQLKHVKSEAMEADVLTKNLCEARLLECNKMMGLKRQ